MSEAGARVPPRPVLGSSLAFTLPCMCVCAASCVVVVVVVAVAVAAAAAAGAVAAAAVAAVVLHLGGCGETAPGLLMRLGIKKKTRRHQ